MSTADIQRLYSMNIEDLFEQLGRTLAPPEFATITRQAAVQRGRAFISGYSERLKAKICTEWNYCKKRSDYGNLQALVYAISPLASSIIGVPETTAVIVGIILIKIGLDKFCNCPNT